jgi:hypothetical protein
LHPLAGSFDNNLLLMPSNKSSVPFEDQDAAANDLLSATQTDGARLPELVSQLQHLQSQNIEKTSEIAQLVSDSHLIFYRSGFAFLLLTLFSWWIIIFTLWTRLMFLSIYTINIRTGK